MKFWHNIRVPKNENGADTGCVEYKGDKDDKDDTIHIKGPTVVYLSGVLSVEEGLNGDPQKWPKIIHDYFDPLLPYFDFDSGFLAKELKDCGRASKNAAGVINMVEKLLGFAYKHNVEDTPSKLQLLPNAKPMGPENQGYVKIYATSYPGTEGMLIDHQALQNDPEHYFDVEAQEIVRRVFLPVLATDVVTSGRGTGWDVKGKKNDIESITKTLSNLTLAGNSYGSSMLIQVENALNHSMQKLGYSAEEQQKIMKSVCALMIGNIAPFKEVKTGNRFRSIFIEGVNDKVAESFNPRKVKIDASVDEMRPFGTPNLQAISDPGFKFTERTGQEKVNFYVKASHSNPKNFFRIDPCGDDRLLVLSNVNEEVAGWKERIPLFDFDWINGDHTGHHMANYVMRGEPYSLLPDVVERVLRNAVMRNQEGKSVPEMQDLFRQASLWPETHGAALNIDRIREGRLSAAINAQFPEQHIGVSAR